MDNDPRLQELADLIDGKGHGRYGLHDVTQRQHALQAAWQAEREGCSSALIAAALLHDIGWSVSGPDGRRHHKASALLIREFPWKTLNPMEVRCVAAVARYHRKALPKSDHKDLRGLPAADRSRVDWLAACLRTADGLDRRHLQRITEISVRILGRRTELWVDAPGKIDEELATADQKSDLLRSLLPGSLKLTHRQPSRGDSAE